MDPFDPSEVDWADWPGPSGSQVAVGKYLLQIGPSDGAWVLPAHSAPPQARLRLTPAVWLPEPPLDLLDRELEIGMAVNALRSGSPGRFEFYGLPGSGKTALLRSLAHHLSGSGFRDGVVYLSAAGRALPDLFRALFDIFYELPAPALPGQDEPRRALRDVQALVLCDDADLSPAEIDTLLAAAPECAFLLAATQRYLRGEGQAQALSGLPSEAALALFERGLGRRLEGEELQAARSLGAISREFPRPVLHAAALARRNTSPLPDLARQIESAAGPLQAIVTGLLTALSGEERQVIFALACLGEASVSGDHLEDLAGLDEIDPILERLEGDGLVEVEGDRCRLAGGLGEAVLNTWVLSEWKDHTLKFYTEWAERQAQESPRLLAEAGPLLHMARWAAGTGRQSEALRLGRTLESSLALAGRWDAWAETLELCLQAAQALGGRGVEAWALHQLGTRLLVLGQERPARSLLVRALQIRQSLGDKAGAAVTQHNLDVLLGSQQDRLPASTAALAPALLPPPDFQPLPAGAGAAPPLQTITVPAARRGLNRPALLLAGALLLVILLVIPAGFLAARYGSRQPPPAGPAAPAPSVTPFIVPTPGSVTYFPLLLRDFDFEAIPGTGGESILPSPTSRFPPYNVPTPITAVPTVNGCGIPSGWVVYTVPAGKTLPQIAAETGVDPEELKRINCLDASGWLDPGRQLFVPRLPQGAATPAAPAGTSVPAATAVPAATTQAPGASPQPTRTVGLPPAMTTPVPAPIPAACLDFEDLQRYAVYVPGDRITTAGFPLAVNGFEDGAGWQVNGGLIEVVVGPLAGSTTQELELDHSSLSLALSNPASGLSLLFTDLSGNLNLEINGQGLVFANFAELNGVNLGGVTLRVTGGAGDGNGSLDLSGPLTTFRIGGQELWLDNLCFK